MILSTLFIVPLQRRQSRMFSKFLFVLLFIVGQNKVVNGFVLEQRQYQKPIENVLNKNNNHRKNIGQQQEQQQSDINNAAGWWIRRKSCSILRSKDHSSSTNEEIPVSVITTTSSTSKNQQDVSKVVPTQPKTQKVSVGTTSMSTPATTSTQKRNVQPLLNINIHTNNNSNTIKKKNLKTFPRYLEVECWKRSDLRGLEPVLQAVADSCQQITRIVQRAQTDELYGVADNINGGSNNDGTAMENIQGEIQQKLDVLCNTIMLRTFCGSNRDAIQLVASEEEEFPRCCSDVMNDSAFASGEFLAVFDPIDGSKNIDASLPVGTIFGIYKKPPGSTSMINLEDDLVKPFLQDGSGLVAAGYCLYSATTVLVLTLGSGVDGFTLDPDTSKFLHTHKDIRIPSAGPIYSFNEANFHDFEEPVKRYLNALKEGSSSVGIRSNARYIGSLVADVHNVLTNGGIYGYPSTRQNPDGKLRLLYESAPMAMIMEQAGGAGSTGKFGRILNYLPKHIHQRVPTFLGSIENVYELDQFYKYYSSSDDNTTR